MNKAALDAFDNMKVLEFLTANVFARSQKDYLVTLKQSAVDTKSKGG